MHRVDDTALADISLEEKREMLSADAERARALEEQHKADFEVAAGRHNVAVAEAELTQREAEVRKAQSQLDLASVRREKTELAAAEQQLDLAREGRRVAEAHLAWARERQALLEQNVAVARANHRWADARYELEKARLAARKGRVPDKDFAVRSFEEQADRTHRDVIDARLDATRHQEAAAKAERAFQEQELKYQGRVKSKH
ncbi:MAG: hypothetical protein HY901_06735 [Deltaproteobacteria bacterium]|nr:hypothetical protein [Deltaproteobacteria bacterium]